MLPVGMTSISILCAVPEPHDRSFAVVLGDLLDREIEVLIARDLNLALLGRSLCFGSHRREKGQQPTRGADRAKSHLFFPFFCGNLPNLRS